ncbi:MAG: UPF0175 family protein [Desulfobacteraceae bacterium]|nr:UPF0175 family protein [Desulfobacteraceae bacterium]
MSIQVTIDLPENIFSVLRTAPDNFFKEMRLVAAAKWYEMGIISASEAAEITETSRQEFLDALYRYEVSPFQLTAEELQEEMSSEQREKQKGLASVVGKWNDFDELEDILTDISLRRHGLH